MYLASGYTSTITLLQNTIYRRDYNWNVDGDGVTEMMGGGEET